MPPRSAEPPPTPIDTRGLKCPWPVLRAARAMRETDEILLLADDPVARTDVPALAQARNWSVTVEHHAGHDAYMLWRDGESPPASY